MRTFIAVELPTEIQRKMAETIEILKSAQAGVKWVEEKNLHLTLKFLGDVPEQKIGSLASVVDQAVKDVGPFPATIEGTGAFPDERKPRVVWIGTGEGSQEFIKLANSLEENLVPQGFGKAEEREFTPHITIGRVKVRKGFPALTQKLKEAKGSKFGRVQVDHLTIMKSTLTPKGPIYEAIKKINLKEG